MMKTRSFVLLGMGLATFCWLYANSFGQPPHAKPESGQEHSLHDPIAFFVASNWQYSYSFPGSPRDVPPVKGSFRFVINEHQIEGYEESPAGPRLVLRGTLKEDSFDNIAWEINFGAVGGQSEPSSGQSIWDCGKRTRFGQWIPASLAISQNNQTISFQYPTLRASSQGDKVEHCQEVSILYQIIRKHKFV